MIFAVPLFVSACTSADLSCGPGTVLRGDQCVPAPSAGADSGGPTDAGVDDSGSSDSGSDGGDSGVSDGGGTDSGSSDGGGADSGDSGGVDSGDSPRTVRVWVLAGQSNMVGIGQVNGLPPRLQLAQDDVEIWWSGEPRWRPLAPSSAYSSGTARYTGPEVSFGRTLADALPDTDVKLIKHAVGGTDLAAYWHPGEAAGDPAAGEGYATLMDTVDAARDALDAAGIEYRIAGFVWMQGESDAIDADTAAAYQVNLQHLVERVRSDLRDPELPFVLGRIDCTGVCAFRETVRAAQQAVADADPYVFAIETDDLGLYPADPWHYQGLGQRVMGERFAQALLGEEPADTPVAAVTWTGGYSSGYTGNYVVGWRFHLDRAVVVTDMGLLDVGGDGLAHTADVGLWDTDSGALLATATVPSWDAADSTLLDGFRTVAVEPFRLEPGDYVVGAQAFASNPDSYAYNGRIDTPPQVAWLEGRYGVGSALVLPTVVTEGTTATASWFGASFRFLPAE
ncbi:MAG: hypothetical protein H6742_08430 [Alphaproteobacteria bacterium]|nr:hypothetical protein [Alphaproteobacteria bacterium]